MVVSWSAWKGHETDKPKDVDVVAMSDILDNAEPNWMELAKSQRMNTDIRRAIFVPLCQPMIILMLSQS